MPEAEVAECAYCGSKDGSGHPCVPGAQLILKGVARVAGGTKSAIPVVLETDVKPTPKSKAPAKAKVPNPVEVGTAAAKAAAKVAGKVAG